MHESQRYGKLAEKQHHAHPGRVPEAPRPVPDTGHVPQGTAMTARAAVVEPASSGDELPAQQVDGVAFGDTYGV